MTVRNDPNRGLPSIAVDGSAEPARTDAPASAAPPPEPPRDTGDTGAVVDRMDARSDARPTTTVASPDRPALDAPTSDGATAPPRPEAAARPAPSAAVLAADVAALIPPAGASRTPPAIAAPADVLRTLVHAAERDGGVDALSRALFAAHHITLPELIARLPRADRERAEPFAQAAFAEAIPGPQRLGIALGADGDLDPAAVAALREDPAMASRLDALAQHPSLRLRGVTVEDVERFAITGAPVPRADGTDPIGRAITQLRENGNWPDLNVVLQTLDTASAILSTRVTQADARIAELNAQLSAEGLSAPDRARLQDELYAATLQRADFAQRKAEVDAQRRSLPATARAQRYTTAASALARLERQLARLPEDSPRRAALLRRIENVRHELQSVAGEVDAIAARAEAANRPVPRSVLQLGVRAHSSTASALLTEASLAPAPAPGAAPALPAALQETGAPGTVGYHLDRAEALDPTLRSDDLSGTRRPRTAAQWTALAAQSSLREAYYSARTSAATRALQATGLLDRDARPTRATTGGEAPLLRGIGVDLVRTEGAQTAQIESIVATAGPSPTDAASARELARVREARAGTREDLATRLMSGRMGEEEAARAADAVTAMQSQADSLRPNAPADAPNGRSGLASQIADLQGEVARLEARVADTSGEERAALEPALTAMRAQLTAQREELSRLDVRYEAITRTTTRPEGAPAGRATEAEAANPPGELQLARERLADSTARSEATALLASAVRDARAPGATGPQPNDPAADATAMRGLLSGADDDMRLAAATLDGIRPVTRLTTEARVAFGQRRAEYTARTGGLVGYIAREETLAARRSDIAASASDPEMARIRADFTPDQLASSDRNRAADTEDAGDVAAARARRQRAAEATAAVDDAERARRALPALGTDASAAERTRATEAADALRDRGVTLRTQVARYIGGDRPDLSGQLLAEACAMTGQAADFAGRHYAPPADAIPGTRTVSRPGLPQIPLAASLREEVASAAAQAMGDSYGRRLVLSSTTETLDLGATDDLRALARQVTGALPEGNATRTAVTTTLAAWDSSIAQARTELAEHRGRVAAEYARTETLLRYYSDEAGAASRDYASFLTYLAYPVTYFTHGGSVRGALEREGRSTIEVQLRSVEEAQRTQLAQLDALRGALATASAGSPPRELTVLTALRAFSERAPDMRFARGQDTNNGDLDRALRSQAMTTLGEIAPAALSDLVPSVGFDPQRTRELGRQDLRYYGTYRWDPAVVEWLSSGGPAPGATTLRRTADGLTELGVRNEGAISDAQQWLGTVTDVRLTDLLGFNTRTWDASWAPNWLRATGRFLDRPQVANIAAEIVAIEVVTLGAGEVVAGGAHLARLGRFLEEAPTLARAAQMVQRGWALPARLVNGGFELLRFGRAGLQTASRLERAWLYGVDAANVFTRGAVQMGMVAGAQHVAGRVARHQFGAHSGLTEAVDILGQFAFISASSEAMRLRSLAFAGRIALNAGTGLAQQAAPQIVRWAMTRGLPPGTPLSAADEERINAYGFWISQLIGVAVPGLVHLRSQVHMERTQRQTAHETARGLLPERAPNSAETRELQRILQEHLLPLSDPNTSPLDAARHFEALRAVADNPRLQPHLDGEALGSVLGSAAERLILARATPRVAPPRLDGDAQARTQALTEYRQALREALVQNNESLPREHRLTSEQIDAMTMQSAAQHALADMAPLTLAADASIEAMQAAARAQVEAVAARLVEAGVSRRDAEHAALGAVHTALMAWVETQHGPNVADLEARSAAVLDVLGNEARRIQDTVGAEMMLARAGVSADRAQQSAEALLRLESAVPTTGLEAYLRATHELLTREGAAPLAAEHTIIGELLGRHRDALSALIAERIGVEPTQAQVVAELSALLTRAGFSDEGTSLAANVVRGEHDSDPASGPRFFDARPLSAEALATADAEGRRMVASAGNIAEILPDVFAMHGPWREVLADAAQAGVSLPASVEELRADARQQAFLAQFSARGASEAPLTGRQTEIEGARGAVSDVRRMVTPEGEFYIKPFNERNRDAPRQEVMASRVDQLLGLGIIPETSIRVVDGERVSAQRAVSRADGFVQALSAPGAIFRDRRLSEGPLSDLRALDYLLAAGDRHPGNLFINPDAGRIMAIDSAGSMQALVPPSAERLYPASGGILPEHYSERFRRAFAELTPERLQQALGDVASPVEIEMLRVRIEIMRRDIIAKHGPDAFRFDAPAAEAPAAVERRPVDTRAARTSTLAAPRRGPIATSAEAGREALRTRLGDAFDALPEAARVEVAATVAAPNADRVTGLAAAAALPAATERSVALVASGGQALSGRIALQNLAGLNHALGASGANQVLRLVSETVREELTRAGVSFEMFRDRGPNLAFIVAANPPNPALNAIVQAALARAESRIAAWAASNPTIGDTRIDGARLPHPKAPNDANRAGIGIVSSLVSVDRASTASTLAEASLTALRERETAWTAGTRPAIDTSLPAIRDVPPLPLPDGRSMGVRGRTPTPRFETAERVREDYFVQMMVRTGRMTEAQARAEFRETAAPRDSVTGFQTAAGRLETLMNARQFLADRAGATGAHPEAFYVEGDISNLSGLNNALGEAGGDRVFSRVSSIFAEELSALGLDPANISLHRHGGDEISAIVVAADTRAMTPPFEQQLQTAMENAQRRVAQMVATETEVTASGQTVALADIVHPKHPGETDYNGTGLSFGMARIRAEDAPDATLSVADRAVEGNKESRLALTREVMEEARAQRTRTEADAAALGASGVRTTQAMAMPPLPMRGSEVMARRSSGQIETGWTLVSISDGVATLARDNMIKTVSMSDVIGLNQFAPGSSIMVRRTDGVIEQGWTVTQVSPDGMVTATARLATGEVATRRASMSELMALNPIDPVARGIALGQAVMPRAPAPRPAERPPPPSAVPSPPQPVRLAAGSGADAQARRYLQHHYLGPGTVIDNGFVDGGRSMSLDARTGAVSSRREILVVDRVRDARLREELRWAAAQTSIADPVERARTIMRHIDQLLSPGGDRRRALAGTSAWEASRQGQEMLIGDVILTGAGMCRHRALLFQLLATQAGLQPALVRGAMRIGDYTEAHAWNELVLPDGRRLLVDVMNPSRDFALSEVRTAGRGMYVTTDGRPLY